MQVHLVFQHVVEFLESKNSDSDNPVGNYFVKCFFFSFYSLSSGLGYFSEQAFESMHHDAKVLFY